MTLSDKAALDAQAERAVMVCPQCEGEGGFVCSQRCDYKAALDLEQSMPGHMGQTRLTGDLARKISDRWEAKP